MTHHPIFRINCAKVPANIEPETKKAHEKYDN